MQVSKLADYEVTNYSIQKTDLCFEIFDDHVIVSSRLEMSYNQGMKREVLFDGVDLEILELKINNDSINDYQYENSKLSFVTNKDSFVFESKVKINPYTNTSCEGLYKSGDILCTQNEAEGFRKITFYYDRPDCMSVFTTKIIADDKKFPWLLSNGNLLSKDTSEAKTTVVWEDPHKKPCYLFALVAGDLALVKDNFVTASGRDVSLEIYVDRGNEDKCTHAIESLKNSMKWDEEKFGLEYDLDTYMVVAVDSFNMGAMENKGLNIFNSQYVLAKKETATDQNFQGVEAVIGHEYFHNWTGNRVTCRDWFQLTLKEGLTVFRDQEFSADMLSRAVKRIEDVKTLRAHQFPEDASGLSHPIKPKEYSEINNFYTATIYEKGAEVIRMIHTIIGADNFRLGMDLYFKRHDGTAVTTEDFVAAMSDASKFDLEHFKVWYDQSGTPVVSVVKEYDDITKTLKLHFSQTAKLNNSNYDCLYIPLKTAIFSLDEKVYDELIFLDSVEKTITIENVEKEFVVSVNRDFTAPVNIQMETSVNDLFNQFKVDDDHFNKFEALNKLNLFIIDEHIRGREIDLTNYLGVLKKLVADESIDNAYKTYLIQTPNYVEVLKTQDIMDIEATFNACRKLKESIAIGLKDEFLKIYKQLDSNKEFSLDSKSMGDRAFKNICLDFLSLHDQFESVARLQFETALNMTDELGALKNLYLQYQDENALTSFYEKWKEETLVIQKWFGLQSCNPSLDLDDLKALEAHSSYDETVPNIVRSVFGAFASANFRLLNDEEAFKYLVEKVAVIDSLNPQVASRVAKSFSFVSKLESSKQSRYREILQTLSKNSELSKDVLEVVSLILDD